MTTDDCFHWVYLCVTLFTVFNRKKGIEGRRTQFELAISSIQKGFDPPGFEERFINDDIGNTFWLFSNLKNMLIAYKVRYKYRERIFH